MQTHAILVIGLYELLGNPTTWNIVESGVKYHNPNYYYTKIILWKSV